MSDGGGSSQPESAEQQEPPASVLSTRRTPASLRRDIAARSAERPAMDRSQRLTYGLRQAAITTLALLVGAQVAERLRPDEALDRGFVATPFLWAIVVWFALLMFHALAFERSQMRDLERAPLYAAGAIAAFTFLTGLATFTIGDVGQRILYLFATSLGALFFWWALLGLGYLVIGRLANRL